MNRKDLWDKFIQTGKVSDYLNYKKAQSRGGYDFSDSELGEEFFTGGPDREDYKYDNKDGRHSNP